MDLVYPSTEDALLAIARSLNMPLESAPHSVRSWELLESAIHRPQFLAHYEDAPLRRQAASLLWGIVKNHPFIDGNKRAGYVLMEAFLRANGAMVVATEDERFDMVIGVAEHGWLVDQVESWLEHHSAPEGSFDQPHDFAPGSE